MTTAPGTHTHPAPARPARWVQWLPAATLAAVLTITASAEYELARTVLNLSPRIAWALPVAVDSYVLVALRSRRDVVPALAVMAGALTASMGAHLAAVGQPQGARLPATLSGPLATAIMTVLVVVAWRVHVLIDRQAEPTTCPDCTPQTAAMHDPRPAAPAISRPLSVVLAASSLANGSGPAHWPTSAPTDASPPTMEPPATNGHALNGRRVVRLAPRVTAPVTSSPSLSGSSADDATLREYVARARADRPGAGELAVRRLLASDGLSASSQRIRAALKHTADPTV